ncbi:DEKNAAC100961 [Brettanomyces naardenensis]|uniref:DEKNAAC100961 n=1 Tax=Brettanomyces naardenensis TaxID=13370 RepID=A0A448YH28_BRENA|nr:DEKNAAC100961 [Brettanomyces naardenensis]
MSRALGGIEQYCYYRNVFNYYHNIVSLTTYSSDVQPPLLYEALKVLLANENGFAINTSDHGSKVGPLDKILYGDLVEYRTVPNFQPNVEISALHDIRFPMDSAEPLWKLFVYNKRHVAFVTDHLICDGTAIINFQRLLLKYMNEVRSSKLELVTPTPSSVVFDKSKIDEIVFPDPMESLIHAKAPFGYIVRTLTEHFAPSWIWNVFKKKRLGKYELTGRSVPIPYGVPPSLVTKLETVSLSKDQLDQLMKLGRSHNVRLTSIIMYVMTRSFEGIIEKYNQSHDLFVHIPVNCRRFVDRNEVLSKQPRYSDQSGCFASSMGFNIPSKPLLRDEVDWDYIAAIQTELVNAIEAKETHSLVGMLNLVNIKGFVKQLGDGGKHFSGSCIEVSNVGFFAMNKEAKDGDFVVQDLWFSQTSGVTGSFVDVNVVGFEGGLRMTLSYDKALPWAGKVEKMAEAAESLFTKLIGE